jgi:hypothetical protein
LDELIHEFSKTDKDPSDHLTALAVTSVSYSPEVALDVLRMFLRYMKKTVLKEIRSRNNTDYKRYLEVHVLGIYPRDITSLVETARLIRTMEMLKRIIGISGDVSTDMIQSYIAEATVLKLHPMRTRTDDSVLYNTKISDIYSSILSDDDKKKKLAEILKPTEKPQ